MEDKFREITGIMPDKVRRKLSIDDIRQMADIAREVELSKYDSRNDTKLHIMRVRELMGTMIGNFLQRSFFHDASKLLSPEKEVFDEFTPKLKASTYGSEEYKGFLASMKVGLDHHYANNSHHPEHFENGIRGMTLLDVLEMFCDWKAATERHADGSLERSIEINQARFGYSDDLKQILHNTIKELGI